MTQEQLITLCHKQVHEAAHDPQDTGFMALTRRDCWTVALASLVLGLALPCVEFATGDLQMRLAELIETQKDDWKKNGPSS